MSFAHASISKGAMLLLGASSLAVSVFDVKHLVHLQIVPHLSSDHQYWRLLVQPLVYANSAELFLAELLIFYTCVPVERVFGSYRFASFLFVSAVVSSLVSVLALVLLRSLGSDINRIPAGPTAILLGTVYQFSRIVPASYRFRIGQFTLSNKAFQFLLAVQLASSQWPESLLAATIGIIVGQLYRADIVGLKSYRLPPRVYKALSQALRPFIGSTRPPRRSVLAMPGENVAAPQEEVVTTAREPPANVAAVAATAPSVVSQWVSELTSRQTNLRRPSDDEITQLQGMFPSVPRPQIVSALQQSTNVERAVEVLLHG